RPIPSDNAFWRSAPTVRFVSLATLTTGVLAIECAFNALTSAFVHSRRFARRFLLFFMTFKLRSVFGRLVLTYHAPETNGSTHAGTPPSRGDLLQHSTPINRPRLHGCALRGLIKKHRRTGVDHGLASSEGVFNRHYDFRRDDPVPRRF